MEEKGREAESKLRAVEVTAEEERRERVALEGKAKEQEGAAAQLRERAGASFLLEETVASLKLQVAQVEESLGKERERADHANQLLTATRSSLATAESELLRARSEAEEAETRWQESVRTSEVLQAQLAEAVQDAERASGGERLKVQQLQRQVLLFLLKSESLVDALFRSPHWRLQTVQQHNSCQRRRLRLRGFPKSLRIISCEHKVY